MHRITIDLTPEMYDRLQAVRKVNGQTVAGLSRVALREYLDKQIPEPRTIASTERP